MTEDFPIIYIRAERRSLSILVDRNGDVRVRIPLRCPMEKAEEFVKKHEVWILKARERALAAKAKNELSPERETALREAAKRYLPERVKYFSARMGLSPSSVRITSARGRWGSCSAKNGLCFSFRVMLLPPAAIDYVVVHELAHIAEHNHSKRFYRVVERELPDYKDRIRLIKES